jgi:hypothetical protein
MYRAKQIMNLGYRDNMLQMLRLLATRAAVYKVSP